MLVVLTMFTARCLFQGTSSTRAQYGATSIVPGFSCLAAPAMRSTTKTWTSTERPTSCSSAARTSARSKSPGLVSGIQWKYMRFFCAVNWVINKRNRIRSQLQERVGLNLSCVVRRNRINRFRTRVGNWFGSEVILRRPCLAEGRTSSVK